MADKVEVSVIVVVSHRYDDVQALYLAYRDAVKKSNFSYEFIYVLDGHFPNVLEQLRSLKREREQIKIVVLAKSFGEATALTAGVEQASGSFILSLPAYYQVEPEEIPNILRELKEADMVIGRRWPRIDALFNRLQARVFNKLLNFMTGSSFKDLGCDVRAFKREVMLEVPIYGSQNRFFPVLVSHRGFRVKELDVAQSEKNTMRRVYRAGLYPAQVLDVLAILFLVKFTKKPLRFFGPIGTLTLGVGGVVSLFIIFERLFFGVRLANRPALLISSLLVVLGVQILALGLLGELIIFTHAKALKEYTIDEIIN